MIDAVSLENSPFRELYIPLAFLILAVGMQLVVLLAYRSFLYRKSAKTSSRIFMAFAILCAGYTAGFFSLIFERFFTYEFPIFNAYFYFQGWFFLSVGIVVFCVLIEQLYQQSFKTRYIFSILGVIAIVLNAVSGPNDWYSIFGFFTFQILNSFILVFLIFLERTASGRTRKLLKLVIWGFLLYFTGFFSISNSLLDFFNSEIPLLITYPILLLGACTIFYGFLQVLVFSDADWKDNCKEIYILSNISKELLYYYNFRDSRQTINQVNPLFTGGIFGLKSIISSISASSDDVESIELESNTFLIRNNPSFVCVLIINHYFGIHEIFLTEIEAIFKENYEFLINSCEIDCSINTSLFDGFSKLIHDLMLK
jgi:hypothetical protein